jgi:uncharacterized membrane protein YedE/YeeE
MKRILAAFLAGGLFGLGLAVSEMINPRRVQGFLDVASWDPTLMLVIIGAVSTTFVGYRLVMKGGKPVFDEGFHLPTAREVDGRLVVGAAVFGAGWGLAGYCPGPALTAIAAGFAEPLSFFAALIVGSLLFDAWRRRRG